MTGSQTPLSGRLRPSLRIALLACSLLLCLPLHLLWRLLRLRSPWPPRFLALAAWSIGARVKIVGKPLGHDAFYVSNHLNWVDILALGGHGRCAFVAHDGIEGWQIGRASGRERVCQYV